MVGEVDDLLDSIICFIPSEPVEYEWTSQPTSTFSEEVCEDVALTRKIACLNNATGCTFSLPPHRIRFGTIRVVTIRFARDLVGLGLSEVSKSILSLFQALTGGPFAGDHISH